MLDGIQSLIRTFARPITLALSILASILGVLILLEFRVQPSTFVPIPQTLTPKEMVDGEPVTWSAVFPISSDEIARALYKRGLRPSTGGPDDTKYWLTSSEMNAADAKVIPAVSTKMDFTWDYKPTAGYLQIHLAGPVESLRCGNEQGNLVGREVVLMNSDGTLRTVTRPENRVIPCRYDVLRIEFPDHSVEEFYIGSVSVPPDYADRMIPYIPRDYQPLPVLDAWLRIALFVLATYLVISPLLALGFLSRNRRFFRITAYVVFYAIWIWYPDFKDGFALDSLVDRTGHPDLVANAPTVLLLCLLLLLDERMKRMETVHQDGHVNM